MWNDSAFQFVPEESASVTSLDIPEALKQLGIEEPLFPTWLPEGFVLAEQKKQMDELSGVRGISSEVPRIRRPLHPPPGFPRR